MFTKFSTTWLIILIGVLIRVGAMVVLSARPFDLSTDFTTQIMPVAQNLLAGKGFTVDGLTPWVWKGPLYPVFTAIFVFFFDGHTIFQRLVMVLLDLLCIPLIVKLGRRTFSPNVGIIAGFIWALYIPSAWLAAVLNYEGLATILLLASLTVLLFKGLTSMSWAIVAGLLLSLVTLCRASTLFLGPFLLLVVWFQLRNTREVFKKLCIFACFSLIGVLPWTIWNYVQFKSVIPVAISWPSSLLWGSEKAFLTTTEKKYELVNRRLGSLGFGVLSEDPVTHAHQLRAAAFRNYLRQWREDPRALLDLYVTKSYYLFFYSDSGRWDRLLAFLNLPIVFLFVLGVLRLRKRWSLEILILFATALYFWLFHLLFHPFFRFLLPVFPIFILFTAYVIEQASKKLVLHKRQ